MLPKLAFLRWYGLNLIEFLPKFYLGLGLGTILSIVVPRSWVMHIVPATLSLGIILSVSCILGAENLNVVQYMTAVPFVPIGIVLGRVFADDDTHTVYAIDLAGIAFGVAVLGLGLSVIGGETLLLLCILLPLWFAFSNIQRLVGLFFGSIVVVVLVTALIVPLTSIPWDFFRMRATILGAGDNLGKYNIYSLGKVAQGQEFVEILASRWDLVARTDIGKTRGSPLNRFLGPEYCALGQCIPNTRYRENTGYSFYYNGQWINAISPEFFLRTEFNLAGPHDEALVIGVGGGADLPSLQAQGVEKVVGAEINAAATWLMSQNDIAPYVTELYKNAVILPMDGRSIVADATNRFDIIVINGAELYIPMPFSRIYLESYLYTVEAFRDYFRSLRDDGVLYVAKFGSYRKRENEEAYKLILTAMEALYEEGVTQPERHLQIVAIPLAIKFFNAENMIAINVWKRPVTPDLYDEILKKLQPPFVNVFSPVDSQFAVPTSNNYLAREIVEYGEALRNGARADYFRRQGSGLVPATDDKPFFYVLEDVRSYNRENLVKILQATAGVILIPVLLAMTFGLVFVRRGGVRMWRSMSVRDVVAFVSLGWLGLLFGVLQATVGQKFHIFLGAPVFSLLTVFGLFPAMSAIASVCTRRSGKRAIVPAIIVIVCGLAFLQIFATPLLSGIEMQSSIARMAFASLLLTPIAFASGTLFPWFVAPFRKRDGRIVALLYAWNTGFIVIGTALALAIAGELGFRTLSLILLGGYIVLLLAIPFVENRPKSPS